MIFSWLASLGLATKLAVGASAVTVGVAGAGAAGVLPPVAQEAFDEVVAPLDEPELAAPVEEEPLEGTTPDDGTDQGIDEGADEGEETADPEDGADDAGETERDAEEAPADEKATHGDKVSAVARDTTLQGRAHGQAVSDAARDKRGSQAKADDDDAGDRDGDETEKPAEDETEESDEDEDEDEAEDEGVKPAKTDKSKGKR